MASINSEMQWLLHLDAPLFCELLETGRR